MIRTSRRAGLIPLMVLVSGLAAGMPAIGQARTNESTASVGVPETDVPIRNITLYRSGVGYFERMGNVSGNTQLQLRFKTDQINDILKSMILLDRDGGMVESVSYGSKEPLERRLASFGVNIASSPSMTDLLSQLRGAQVKVFASADQVVGTILGVENRLTSPSKEVPAINVPHLNLVTANGLRSIAITDISTFEILDKELASELAKALATLAEYRADRTKTVDIRFSGTGARRVVVGYVHETPVWKTSYRLVLPDKDPAKDAKGQLVMQGWAIVENTTDQDWSNVHLSLVSGRPVSFQMDLYEPLYTFRPTIPVPTIPGVMPKAYAAGMDLDVRDKLQEQAAALSERAYSFAAKARGGGEGRAPGAPAPASAAPMVADLAGGSRGGLSADDLANYAPQAQAQGGEVGEVFQYEVQTPVTVERQRSAMIPIISANVTGRRVSIFNQSDGRPNPMRGVELTNETDLQLLPGPISVFDGAAYAGDAQIGHISRGDKRLLAYSLDLDVNTLTKQQSDTTLRKLKIVNGQVLQTMRSVSGVSYAFDNKDAKRGRIIIVEQQRLPGWELVEPKKPLEETQELYRFEVSVEPGKTATFSVAQERTDSETLAVTSFDLQTIIAYHKDGKLSDAVLKAMQEVAKRQGDINTVEREITEFDRQAKDVSEEQSRIRNNMNTIDRNSDLYKRYMTKLNTQETQLEDLRENRNKANERLETLRREFNEFLRTLNAD